ncbi:3'(2'),5'-bisphosphate nucleotidase CysQ [Galbibacter sp. PAP.153]|uniref:3'(2'),5'-bisphosphate nucleotidase CysQ n=1 Tax=Galbibacter sp. PAP.153 TaxID=3104623 RepID=UPI00300955B5
MNIENKLIQIAIKAAVRAGMNIMEVYNGADFDVSLKADNSPITKADKQANKIITQILSTTGIPIISEENSIIDYKIRKHWEQCWIVDPLDGTKEFVKRNGEFTVNIALVKNQKPILGVVYVPVTKALYYGIVPKEKAYKTILDNPSEEFFISGQELSGPEKNSSIIKIVGSRSHMSSATKGIISAIKKGSKKVEMVSVGSSLKFCLLAEGKATVYPRYSPTMEWDTAAGHALCSAVGLRVLNAETQDPLRYNKKELINPSFIVN